MIDFNSDVIDQVQNLDDAQFMELFGINQMVKNMQTSVKEMASMSGKAREVAERKLRNALTPDVDANRLSWIIDDAKYAEKGSPADVCCD